MAVLVLVIVAPLLLCVVLSRYEAQRIARREADFTSVFILNQLRSILSQGRTAAKALVPHTLARCEQIAPELTRRAAVTPYLRTLNIVEDDHIACSSAFGLQAVPFSTFKDAPAHVPSGEWMMMVGNTPMVPHRPALLMGEPALGGRVVVAIVDDRYLLDLLHAAAPLNVFRQVELRLGGGDTLYEAAVDVSLEDSPLLTDDRMLLAGSLVELKIFGLRSRIDHAWGGLLLRYMPWAVALSIVLAWFVYREQQSRRSRREQLLKAIRANEFHVEYQPFYGVVSGRCEGAEALLRWARPGLGPVHPDEFIGAAEEEQVMVPLTQHLLKLIACDFPLLNTLPGFHLGINFAPEHLSSASLQVDVCALLEAIGGRQPQMVLEITERSLMRNTAEARKNLVALREAGVQVAIDDFGTGYCSLSYLEKFPFDILKIDRGFVLTIDTEEPRSAVVLDAIIDLAHRLGASLVAEGVETGAQLDYLRKRNVSLVQGYLYAKPMTAEAFGTWYRTIGLQARTQIPEASVR